MYALTYKDKTGQASALPLVKELLTIGRTPENDLQVFDHLASRKHAQIAKVGEKYILKDLNSANGTYLNGQAVKKEVELKKGDKILIGITEIIFEEVPESKVPTLQPVLPPGEASPREGEMVKSADLFYLAPSPEVIPPSGPLPSSSLVGMRGRQDFYLLYQLGKLLVSSPSMKEFLQAALDLTMEVIQAERGAVIMRDPKTQELTPVALRHLDKRIKEGFTVSQTIVDKVVSQHQGIITTDAQADPRFLEAMSVAQMNVLSVLCAPIYAGQETYGALYLDSRLKSRAFAEEDLDLLMAVAHQLALGVHQERLLEKIRGETVLLSNLERYLSAEVVQAVMEQSDVQGQVVLDMVEREVTVLFADIEKFTTLAEKMKPKEVALLLNSYFELVTDIIFKHKGMLNKYVGDSIMAVFGAPLAYDDHAPMAVKAALKILAELERFMANIKEDKRFTIRIGINTGEVVAGNVGSFQRVEYTVLGDTVNIAQRLEYMASPNSIFIGEKTYQKIVGAYGQKPLPFEIRDLGSHPLKGKQQEVRVYQVLRKG